MTAALDRVGARATAAAPPWTLAVAAMLSIQLGLALSAGLLISDLGSAGTAWLRLTLGALILLAIARPPISSTRRRRAAATGARGGDRAHLLLTQRGRAMTAPPRCGGLHE